MCNMENNYYSQLCIWKCLSKLYLYVFMIGSVATGYNMDLTSPVIRQGTNNTFFGYSVAIHSEGDEDMLIVGAPQGDSNVPGITRGGAIYRCPVWPYNNEGECQLLVLEKENVNIDTDRSHQWLGATVKSSGGPGGKVLSCSPRRKKAFSDGHYLEPIGGCYVSSNNFTTTKFRHPCHPKTERQIGFDKDTHCQAGFSADMKRDGRFVLGAPGKDKGMGTVYIPQRNSFRSLQIERLVFDSYVGYSVAQGQRGVDLVAGAPRAGRFMQGKVFIYKSRTAQNRRKQLIGQQLGSYFGHSVAVTDLNNDGRDDIIVGAPNYWNKDMQQINVGQVHVYYQTQGGNFDEEHKSVITGQKTNGRFGFTVAPLGDLNDDGFNDFAVSAPYEGDGAVYIFNGKRETIHTSASQVLRPADFPTNITMKRFGFALSGNKDADKNSFPDLLIGAYESDTVILVRTKPIIRPEISITFFQDGVQLSRLNTSASFNSFSFEMCLSYNVLGTTDEHTFEILLRLDADKSNPRASFKDDKSNQKYLEVNITREERHCSNWTAVMGDLDQIQDKLSPISVRVTVSLVENEGALDVGQVTPYLETPSQYWEEQIPMFYRCINNGTCAPDLTLTVESDTEYMYMGDSDELSINVTVTNSADEAFGAKLYVDIPESFELSSYKAIHAESSITCELGAPTETVVVCNIGNPLPTMMTTKFTLSFDVRDVPGHTENLFLNLTTNSTTMEEVDTLWDNNQTVRISLVPKVEFEVGGFSNIERHVYKERQNDDGNYTHEKQVGGQIIHNYWVRNKGPAAIEDATLTISWPQRTERGEYLLYLTELKITGDEECYVEDDDLNPESFQLNYYPYDVQFSRRRDVNISELENLGTSTRKRRDTGLGASSSESLLNPTESPLNPNPKAFLADCSKGYAGCVNITCNITNVPRNSEIILLTIRSRLHTITVQNPESRPWNIVSRAQFTINRLPYVAQPVELSSKSQTLSLWVTPTTRNMMDTVPLWAIILSVALGNILLIIIMLCLWKIGFFKRKRIRGMTELVEVEENGKSIQIVHVSHDQTNGRE